MTDTVQPDRRPAIWPWLVMPMIALTAFYCLDRLAREAGEQAVTPKSAPTSSSAETGAASSEPVLNAQAVDSTDSETTTENTETVDPSSAASPPK